eukprot:Anaeramoba_flamelloidesa571343_40.p1 GENE.a571343_40~~a571343_40.p1  ORF type:complete len:296 (-),score=32.67 a571343_40:232-1119(-)
MENSESKSFEAKTLADAYELASQEFECSITDLDITIIQQGSNGILGFFKKNAIISAKIVTTRYTPKKKKRENNNHKFKKNVKIKDISNRIDSSNEHKEGKTSKKDIYQEYKNDPKVEPKEKIFDNFYTNNSRRDDIPLNIVDNQTVKEIEEKVNHLFSHACYDINPIKVELKEDNIIYIEFSGNDSALLIGKEGYRYKALSYILFNWLHKSYGLTLKLEVAEFLQTQEAAIGRYLEPVIENIEQNGGAKTKTLDGILVHIALTKLRERFPNKYVAIKTNQRGDKFVVVNEYKNNN